MALVSTQVVENEMTLPREGREGACDAAEGQSINRADHPHPLKPSSFLSFEVMNAQ